METCVSDFLLALSNTMFGAILARDNLIRRLHAPAAPRRCFGMQSTLLVQNPSTATYINILRSYFVAGAVAEVVRPLKRLSPVDTEHAQTCCASLVRSATFSL